MYNIFSADPMRLNPILLAMVMPSGSMVTSAQPSVTISKIKKRLLSSFKSFVKFFGRLKERGLLIDAILKFLFRWVAAFVPAGRDDVARSPQNRLNRNFETALGNDFHRPNPSGN